jgi:hypothetical protein
LPLTYLDDFTAKVDKVTTKQIQDAFKRRIDPDSLATVIVGAPEVEKANKYGSHHRRHPPQPPHRNSRCRRIAPHAGPGA